MFVKQVLDFTTEVTLVNTSLGIMHSRFAFWSVTNRLHELLMSSDMLIAHVLCAELGYGTAFIT